MAKGSERNAQHDLSKYVGKGGSSCTPAFAKGGSVKLTGGTLKNSTSNGKAQTFSGKTMKTSVPAMGAKMGAKKAPKGV